MTWHLKGVPPQVSAQRLADRRAIRSLSRLYGAGDPFLFVVHEPFATLDEFVGLINESRSLALQIPSRFVCLGTHQTSCFISLAIGFDPECRCRNRVQRGFRLLAPPLNLPESSTVLSYVCLP